MDYDSKLIYDMATISEEEYCELYNEEMIDAVEQNEYLGIYINKTLDKIMGQKRVIDGFNDNIDYYFNTEFRETLSLGSFNMDKFSSCKSYRPAYLRVNFVFLNMTLNEFKDDVETYLVEDKKAHHFIVNPRLYKRTFHPLNPEDDEKMYLSIAHVLHYRHYKPTYNFIMRINEFFYRLTGEILFFLLDWNYDEKYKK